jgi:imidazole glycerol-phosphate synthase subunit HisH
MRVCILDYGSGNVKSVYNLFVSLAPHVMISNEVAEIEQATHIILPGVGAFAAAMRRINETLPLAQLREQVLHQKKPFLGICVGMQVLMETGFEFGEHAGLGWLPGRVEKLESQNLPLPHIGWNNIRVCPDQARSPLLQGLENDPDFYFVHSYIVQPQQAQHKQAVTDYGQDFCSVIVHENIHGVQFHPEKSQRAGIRLAKNFLALS